jgi:hypothetical protein
MSQTIKIVIKRSLLVACLWLAPGVIADSYDRKDFNYRSYKSDTSIGFYTNKPCDFINIDHIVSLKDAYESGASSWGASKKKTFANDRSNHVPSCGRVNSSKGSVRVCNADHRGRPSGVLADRTLPVLPYSPWRDGFAYPTATTFTTATTGFASLIG